MTLVIIIVAQVVVAVVAVAFTMWSSFSFIMDIYGNKIDFAVTVSDITEFVLLIVAIAAVWKIEDFSVRSVIFIAFAAVSIVLAFTPKMTGTYFHYQEFRFEQNIRDTHKKEFFSNLDVAKAQLAAQNKYSSDAAFNLIMACLHADYGYEGGEDYSKQALSVLRETFSAKLIDPNGRLTGKQYGNLEGQTIYAYVYAITTNDYAGNIKYENINSRLKEVLQMFVDAGADTRVTDKEGRKLMDYLKSI